MDWIFPIVVGWCGTGFPFKWWGGGGGGFDPDWPWPPNCWVCWGILGSVSAVILEMLVGSHLGEAGLASRLAVDFFAGGFGSTAISGLMGLMKGGRANR